MSAGTLVGAPIRGCSGSRSVVLAVSYSPGECTRSGPRARPSDGPVVSAGTAVSVRARPRACGAAPGPRPAATRRTNLGAVAEDHIEVAPVREVDRRTRPRRRTRTSAARRRLGRVEELRAAAPDERRRPAARSRRSGAGSARRSGCADGARPRCRRQLQHASDALAGLGADRDDRREVEERRLVPDPLDVLVEGPVGLVLDEVPLVDGDDEALALLDDVARDVGVLGGQPLDGVDDEDGDVGAETACSARSVE